MSVDVSVDTFQAEVLESTAPVLVDFWATWCAPCKAIAPHLESLATELEGQIKVVKVDAEKCVPLVQQYAVSNMPTFLVIKAGEVVARKVGTAGGLQGLRDLVTPHI